MAEAAKPTTVRIDESHKARANEETRRALAAAEAKELGLVADDAPAFDDADELMAFLEGG